MTSMFFGWFKSEFAVDGWCYFSFCFIYTCSSAFGLLSKVEQSFCYRLICFIGSQDHSGWKGSQEASQPNFLPKAGSVKRSDEVLQGFIQLHLENLWGGDCNLTDSLLHCLAVLIAKKVFCYVQSEPFFLNLHLFSLVPSHHIP